MVRFWKHDCPVDGLLSIACGEACSWCGAVEKAPRLRLLPPASPGSASPEESA